MARYTGATCRFVEEKVWSYSLKGDRCYTDKCAFARRGYAPGQHGQSKKENI